MDGLRIEHMIDDRPPGRGGELSGVLDQLERCLTPLDRSSMHIVRLRWPAFTVDVVEALPNPLGDELPVGAVALRRLLEVGAGHLAAAKAAHLESCRAAAVQARE
ncbi:MAG: hypothetical protein JWQ99_1054, partial [Blastococcus sp.]|nr:hypothetical protein [Blastococcus sp.]